MSNHKSTDRGTSVGRPLIALDSSTPGRPKGSRSRLQPTFPYNSGPAESLLTFGDVLKHLRAQSRLTQRELAEKASRSERGISDLERGVNRKPQQHTLQALAGALGLTPDQRTLFERAALSDAISADELRAVFSSLPPLIGRATESALISRLLSGQGPLLVVFTGEPGIGKSRLLREAVARGRSSGWYVFEGGCAPLHVRDPYSPITEALASYVTYERLTLADLSRHGHDWLVRLLSGRGVRATPTDDEPLRRTSEEDRRILFAAASRFLGDAAVAGTLLVLDDLQWAGADALDFLTALIRSPARRPIRVVGAYRSSEVGADDPLSRLLAYLSSQQLAHRHELGALSDDDAAGLLDSLLGRTAPEMGAQRQHILHRAGGVPLYLVSWVHSLHARASAGLPSSSGPKADPAGGDLSCEEIPQDVAESIHWRLGLLPAASRDLLDVVATANRAIPFSVLQSVSRHLGRSEQDQVGALEAAQHARVLTEWGRESYRFTHDLIREVVWEDLSMARRVFLHHQLAEALEHSRAHASRCNAAELAWHWLQANEEARALPYALQAGDQASGVYAYAEAEYHYHTALEVAGDLGDGSREAEAQEKLGGIAFTLARYDEALAFYAHAAAAYRAAGDLEGEVRVATQLGWVHTLRGTPDEGLALIQRLLDLSARDRLLVHTQVTLYDTLAQFHFGRGCYHEQLEAAECAAALARSAGDDALLSRVEIRRGAALVHMGRCDEALEALEGAIPLAEATGELWNLAMALNYAGLVYLFRSEFEQDRSYAQRALELAERADDPALIAYMLFRRAMPTFYARQWNEARMDLQRSAALSDQLGTSWLSGCALLGLGMLDLAEGQRERGTAYLQKVITEGARVSNPGMVWFARGALAERDLLEGNPQTALDWLAPLVDRSLNADGQLAMFMPLVAWAYLDLGEAAQADQWMARALTSAGQMGYRATVAETLRVRALAAVRRDDWAHAAAALEEALALERAIPDPYAEAKTLRVYGLLYLWKGEQTQARERLESALAILNRLGERLYAEHIEAELVDIG